MATMSKTANVSGTMRGPNGVAWGGDNGRAMADATERWVSSTAECQREMSEFVATRLQKDRDTFEQMLGCKNLSDALAVQTRWVEETVRDYNAEMAKLMELCTRSMNGGRGTR